MKLTGVAYTQSSVYGDGATIHAANYAYMNDGNADGSINDAQTGTKLDTNAYVRADIGASKWVDHIVVGYDYLSNLPLGWGPATLQGAVVEGSNDGTTYTQILASIPSYAAAGSPAGGLYSITVGANYRYIRIRRGGSGYVAILEFQVWGW